MAILLALPHKARFIRVIKPALSVYTEVPFIEQKTPDSYWKNYSNDQ
jgi:hypothetical protein